MARNASEENLDLNKEYKIVQMVKKESMQILKNTPEMMEGH